MLLLFPIIALAITSVVGIPFTTVFDFAPRRRTIGGIYLCTGENWTGTCGYSVQDLGTCIVLGDDWNNRIVSLGPDDRTVVVVFDSADCSGPAIAFVNPGNPDLTTLGADNAISSFVVLGY
ncbi:hypothetical protein M422DRAFT_250723 [Sphaerobolus stellatus SS14]|uniref:Uncharacterized protein n=1 Tax=Sphaerobolus stellatus (strain SS14) TaxID=990650 RepID=A0A0C9VG46_SPHS4|nr:hypothetical protein M422DRAFT_250723 [Sphaerobolus stellatus SS14]